MNITATMAYQSWGYLGVAVVGVCILLVTMLASHALVVVFKKIFGKQTGGEKAGSIFTNIIRIIIFTIGISLILQICFGIDPTVIWGALGISGIALSLGLQSTISDFFSGIQVTLGRQIIIGDWMRCGNVEGRIRDIDWRQTVLVDSDDNVHYIPNSVLTSQTFSCLAPCQIVRIPVTVNAQADITKLGASLSELADEILTEQGLLYPEKHCCFRAKSQTAEGVNAELLCYVDREQIASVISALVSPAVSDALEAHDAAPRWTTSAL